MRFGGGHQVCLNPANPTAHAAARTYFINDGQQFTDSSANGGRDERKLRRSGAEGKATA